ncbi:MAG: efflux RND transporter periplasmic adaptor subunit [Thiohalospira sp.]
MPPRTLPLLLLIALLPAACGEGGQEEGAEDREETAKDEDPRVVRTVTVEAGEQAAWSLVGTVRARHEAERGFRAGGELVERMVDAGEHVREGDPLARLDDSDRRRELEAARAGLTEAQARADYARAEAERVAEMVTTDNVSEQEHDRAESEAAAAEAALLAARAERDLAAERLAWTTLRAPADGTVMEVLAEPGEVVGTGEPVVRFAHGAREVEVSIPGIRREGAVETARLPGGEAVELRDLAAGADPATRTWRARYTLPDDADDRPLGSTVRLTFQPEEEVVRIPVGALADRGEGTAVWAVEDGAVERRSVEVVATGQETAEVRGIEPGVEVVAAGTHTLQPGQPVRVRSGR